DSLDHLARAHARTRPTTSTPAPMLRRTLLLLAAAAAVAPRVAAAQASRPDSADQFLWLEDAHGARAMAWVKAENAKTTAVLEHDPRFANIYKAALTMARAKDRIPDVSFV